MKLRIYLTLLVLALASALVGGSTWALFTDQAETGAVLFTTGTVEISGGDIITNTEEGHGLITWCVTNTGSKAAYIRVRARGGITECGEPDSAGLEGERYANGAWARYLLYELNSGPKTVMLLQGRQNTVQVGWVTVENDLQNLYVQIDTINGWTMHGTKLYADTVKPDTSPSVIPGNGWTTKNNNLGDVTTDLYTVPLTQDILSDGEVYVVTHADIRQCPVSWELVPGNWLQMEENGVTWWYYFEPVPPQTTVCITLKVSGYDAGVEYYLDAQAVQASHNAIGLVWPQNPY